MSTESDCDKARQLVYDLLKKREEVEAIEIQLAQLLRINGTSVAQETKDETVVAEKPATCDNRGRRYRLAYKGRSLSVREAAKVIGVSVDTIRCRIKRGWPVERILEEPAYRRLEVDPPTDGGTDPRPASPLQPAAEAAEGGLDPEPVHLVSPSPPSTEAEQPARLDPKVVYKYKAQLPGEDTRSAVLRLTKAGMPSAQVAEQLDVNRYVVGRYLGLLRRNGELPPAEYAKEKTRDPIPANAADPEQDDNDPSDVSGLAEPDAEEDPIDKLPEAEGGPAAASAQPDLQAGDTVDDLREDVRKQCQISGKPCGPATLMTTLAGRHKHAHRATVSPIGNGSTCSDDSGHAHAIANFKVRMAHGHEHGLQTSY